MKLHKGLLLMLCWISTPGVTMSLLEDETPASLAVGDAQEAYDRGDTRLLGIMTRGVSVPGVESARLDQAKLRCGLRTIQRSDVIRNREQLALMRQQSGYITRYNQTMLGLCLDDD